MIVVPFTVGPQTSATLDNDNPEMMSEDMRRDLLRQKWEQEEEENLKKTKLHYRDVLYDEARTHGAAFYNFSRLFVMFFLILTNKNKFLV